MLIIIIPRTLDGCMPPSEGLAINAAPVEVQVMGNISTPTDTPLPAADSWGNNQGRAHVQARTPTRTRTHSF